MYQRSGDRIVIERTTPADHFTVVPNDLIRDERLSRFARSCLIEVLSSSDGWRNTADDLWRRASTGRRGEGRDAYRRAFKEMEAAGYLTRSRAQDPSGTWHTTLHFRAVAEQAASSQPASSQVAPTPEQPVVGSPVVGQPGVNREVPQRSNYRSGSTELSMVASRRAHAVNCASGADTFDARMIADEGEQIRHVREAAFVTLGESVGEEDALNIWANYVQGNGKPVRQPVSFLCGIFKDFFCIDGVLSNTPEREAS